MPASSGTCGGFLDLPAELQVEIYRHLIDSTSFSLYDFRGLYMANQQTKAEIEEEFLKKLCNNLKYMQDLGESQNFRHLIRLEFEVPKNAQEALNFELALRIRVAGDFYEQDKIQKQVLGALTPDLPFDFDRLAEKIRTIETLILDAGPLLHEIRNDVQELVYGYAFKYGKWEAKAGYDNTGPLREISILCLFGLIPWWWP